MKKSKSCDDVVQISSGDEPLLFRYESLRYLPSLVKSLCFTCDAWIVGSGARFCCGKVVGSPRDWDVIVPLHMWFSAVRSLPYQATVNTLGGVKCRTEDNSSIDVWPEDLGRFMQRAGTTDLIAVSPQTQQVCVCSPRG